jgi:hypothetical protein
MWSWIARITVPVFGDSSSATAQPAAHGAGPGPIAIPRDDPNVASSQNYWWSPTVTLCPTAHVGGLGTNGAGSVLDAMLATDPAPAQAATTDSLVISDDTASWNQYSLNEMSGLVCEFHNHGLTP